MATAGHVSVDVYRQRLVALGTSPQGPLYRWVARQAAAVESRAKMLVSGQLVNVQTGNLRSSIGSQIEVRGTVVAGVIRADARYSYWVHEGTRPHDIYPRAGRHMSVQASRRLTVVGGGARENVRGGVLTGWQFGGRTVFASHVHHPGTTGRPFLRNALREVMSK